MNKTKKVAWHKHIVKANKHHEKEKALKASGVVTTTTTTTPTARR
ncbi:MAG TPA: hypothetical protein VNG51_22980 [Ktedonobacteraceae bacterium]|nr:hypothetical protein [Ktedonobacteraceae bacterium]